MKSLFIITIIILSISKVLAAPKSPTASKRWPIVFVPSLRGGGGYTSILGTAYETADVSGDLTVYYLKNHIVGGINGEYSYTVTYHRAKSESEAFNRAEGSVLLGVYFNDGSKVVGGYTPYTQMKSLSTMDVYKGTGFNGAIHWMAAYPFQIILYAKQNIYTERITADGTVSKLSGDQTLLHFVAGIGIGYEF